MAEARSFGRLADGEDIREVIIAAGDLSVTVISFGAVIRDIRLAGIDHPLVLGFDRLEDYVEHSPHFGAIAGRCANRIRAGRLEIDGDVHQLSLNERGINHLHGGWRGFGKRAWRLVDHDDSSVTVAITRDDGDEGYPGKVEANCRYVVEAPATLRLEATATADVPTIVNLAQHTYFNLDDSTDILDHEVRFHADRYTPVDGDSIPTGEIASVAGTDFDFRESRPIRRINNDRRVIYDINMVVGDEVSSEPRPHARLSSPKNGLALDIRSTQPGNQFYDGSWMRIAVPGHGGRRYAVNGGVCFEPQFFPDSPNQPNFPDAILRPGDTYRQSSVWTFSRS